jgi:leucyl aminopeptidase
MLELPNFTPLRVTQDTKGITRKAVDQLDHLLIVVHRKAAPAELARTPLGRRLPRLYERARKSAVAAIGMRLENPKSTGVTVALTAPEAAFERLTWARTTVARCRRDDSGSRLGVVALGFDAEARESVLRAVSSAAAAAAFELPSFKKSKRRRGLRLRTLVLFPGETRLDLKETLAIAHGNNIARWLTAMPPNKLTAGQYRSVLETFANEHGLSHEFLDENELAARQAGAFLAVSQGNAERDAGIMRLVYTPKAGAESRIALVGKGIIFDTGGNNLKPFKSMLDMHIDMQGSAVALGALIALAELRVPYAVDCWLAITENRLSARAYKPQDVVTASNGKTIQVIHTDAEGRMVLADTLAIAEREKPSLIIDFATLTGACVAALTERYSGVFTNRPSAHEALVAAGQESGERVWPFPMDPDFEEPLKSETADIKQCAADGAGDHILAARFLSQFVHSTTPWVHVDLSAAQHRGGLAHIPTDITGFGVGLTVELLRHQLSAVGELRALLSP